MTMNKLIVALEVSRDYILNRHNMGARKREKQRLHVLKLTKEALEDHQHKHPDADKADLTKQIV